MTLKCQFFLKKSQKLHSNWGLRPQIPGGCGLYPRSSSVVRVTKPFCSLLCLNVTFLEQKKFNFGSNLLSNILAMLQESNTAFSTFLANHWHPFTYVFFDWCILILDAWESDGCSSNRLMLCFGRIVRARLRVNQTDRISSTSCPVDIWLHPCKLAAYLNHKAELIRRVGKIRYSLLFCYRLSQMLCF